ncbi:flagellar motor stator protein MotA [Acidimangrovimonas pyrenivorans]|uniref:Flagellar motor stator protein MotA n=1 Tax=Acidimangrovimonas pyrenivorans TaxID=2030798 RepID=A0ABV7ANB6_9RHOB
MNLIIGFVLVAASVLGGFAAMGGSLSVLWQPFELIIIVGAALGAFVIANPVSVLVDTLRSLLAIGRQRPYDKEDYLELFALLYMLFKTGKDDLKSLEKDLDDPLTSKFFSAFPAISGKRRNVVFLADYLRLVLLGSEKSHELEPLIDTEIDSIEQELNKVPNALNVMADSLPAVGIVAAVLGVINAMGAISEPPAVLGALIGGAMVGTFMGVLLSYGVVGPIAGAIRDRREQEVTYFLAVKSSLMAFLNGYHPRICVEYARKTVSEEVRPHFEEVEGAMRDASQRTGMELGG